MSSSSPERDGVALATGNRQAAATAVPDIAHVGYHRTGTNFLQQEVFPRLGTHIFRPEQSGWHFFDDPGSFDEAAARAYFAAEQAKNTAGRPFLISHERLTGTAEHDDLSVAGKLRKLNPDMKIVIVVRSQYGMFRSLYHLHVKRGGSDQYADFVQRLIAGGRCDYGAMVGHLTEQFGQGRVLTLLYEDLAESPETFLQELCDFIEAPAVSVPYTRVNARSSDSALRVRRFLNDKLAEGAGPASRKGLLSRLAQALALKADRMKEELSGGPVLKIDAEAERQTIHEAYAASNRHLSALLDRPLGPHGYPV